MLKRILLIAAATLAILAVAVALALWAFFAAWLPSKGKALLVQTVEQRTPARLALRSLQYDPLRGFVLEGVRITARETQALWADVPNLQVQVDWLPLLIGRRLVVRGHAAMAQPLQTDLSVAAHYHTDTRALALDIRTEDVALNRIGAPLDRFMPASLKDGVLRFDLHLQQFPVAGPTVSGQVSGRQLVWSTPTWTLRGDLALDGSALMRGGWELDARATLSGGSADGVRYAGPISDLQGTARLKDGRIDIERLTGVMLGSPWTLEGTVLTNTQPSLEGRLASRANLAALTSAFPAWRAEGPADVQIVCRGSLHPTVFLDCLSRAELQGATLAAPRWSHPLTDLRGRVEYDGLAQRLAASTRFMVKGEPLTLEAVYEGAGTPRLVATVGLPQGRLQLASRITPQEILLDDAQLSIERTRLSAHGRLARGASEPSALDGSGVVDFEELSHISFLPLPALTAWQVEGLSQVDAQFRGRLSDWSAATLQARLDADHLRVRGLPLQQVTATLEQTEGLMRLSVPSALIAGGKAWGEVIVKHDPDARTRTFVAQGDLVSVQLAALAQAIPAWKQRAMSGNASAHALVSGTWEQRASWKGEGWLNASGEQLGDVPLLDKLFHGLFGVLADRLGLESLRRAQITQASVTWRMSQERLSTEDLRLGGMAGTEPVAVYAKGSAGLDRTIDFVIEPEFSEGVLKQAPVTASLAGTVLKAAGQLDRLRRLIGRHRLTGTLEHPDYRFEFTTQEIFKQLAPGPEELLQQLFDSVRR